MSARSFTTRPTSWERPDQLLSPADRESLLFSHGAEIGGLDGIPAAVRDRVNRSLVLEQKDKPLEKKSRLMAQDGNDDLRKCIDDFNNKLGGSTPSRNVLQPPQRGTPAAVPAQDQ
jgi:hypothetical protein